MWQTAAVDADRYLARLGVDTPDATLAGLRSLQRAHLEAVPFENASVLRGEPIALEPELLVSKVAEAGRGGFCFELNGAFAELLSALGFEVALLPGRFWSDRGLGPLNEHLCLRVTIDGVAWLADVGAGFSFREPLRLVRDLEQDDPSGRFRIVAAQDDASSLDVEWRHSDGVYHSHYRFRGEPVQLSAFADVCEFLRMSPESPFTQGWICARALPDGWATLDGSRLVVTQGDARMEETISGEALDEALERWFGIRPA